MTATQAVASSAGPGAASALGLLARASSPAERIAGGWLRPADDSAVTNERLARWSQRVADGRPERVADVLAEHGLTLDQWRVGLGDVTVVPGEPLPEWAEDALTLLDMVGIESEWPDPPLLREVAGDGLPVWVDPDQPWRFHPGFRDWLAAARRDVDSWSASAPIADTARHELVLDLARRQLSVSGALLMEAAAARSPDDQLFATDARRDWDELWITHPVLARLLATVWRQWRETTAELCGRIAADLPTICPGVEVTRIELAQGDQHRGGRGVARLRLSDDTSVFLKPRADGLHRLLGGVLAQVDAAGTALGLRLPVIIERDGYSWAREVRSGDCPDEQGVDAYFRRAGALVRVAQVMGSNDLHHENFIAAPDLPVLVDFETVVAPGRLRTAPPRDRLSARLSDTPGPTSMVTSVVSGPPGRGTADIGALAGPTDALTPYAVRTLVLDKDGPALRSTRVPLANGAALPTRDGRRVALRGHEQALIEGYADVQARLESLVDADHIPVPEPEPTVRFLARPTRIYAQLLVLSTAPAALVDGVEREFVLERLYRATGTAPPGLIGCEVEAMRELDVPMFTVGFTQEDLVSDRGRLLPHALQEAPDMRTRNRLRAAAGRSDQVDDLRATVFAMEPDDPRPEPVEGPTSSRPELVEGPRASGGSASPAGGRSRRQSSSVAEEDDGGRQERIRTERTTLIDRYEPIRLLLDRAIDLPGGAVAWLGLEHDPNRNRWAYDRLSAGLTGQAGIGLALATVAARATDPPSDCAAVARAALLGSVERIGLGHRGPADAFTGPAGVLYAAAGAARLLDDAVLLAGARSLIEPVLRAARRDEASLVIDGTAGGILALLHLPDDGRVADALTELAALSPSEHDVDPPDSWSVSLPSRVYGGALARYRLALLRPDRTVRSEPTGFPELPAPAGPGDLIARATVGPSDATGQPGPLPDDDRLRVLLDHAVLAQAALRSTADPVWAERRDQLVDVILARRARTGRWCAPLLAPDATLLSPVHGLAALAGICTDLGPDLPIVRALG